MRSFSSASLGFVALAILTGPGLFRRCRMNHRFYTDYRDYNAGINRLGRALRAGPSHNGTGQSRA